MLFVVTLKFRGYRPLGFQIAAVSSNYLLQLVLLQQELALLLLLQAFAGALIPTSFTSSISKVSSSRSRISGDAFSSSIGTVIIRFTRNEDSTGRSYGAIGVKIVSSYLEACCK